MSKSAVDHMDVRWRVKGTTQWSPPRSYPPAAEVSVDGLERGKDYEFEVRNVSTCGANSIWVSSDYTVPDAPVGTLTLVAMQQGIQDASSSAAAANAQLADIASDNVLSPAEKPTVMRDYSVITTEQAGIDAQATQYGVTTQKSDYDNAISTLTAYLNTLNSPVPWNNKSGNTDITGSTFKSYFTSVYTARQTLLNAIYATAKYYADNAQSSANRIALSNPSFENNLTNGPQQTYVQGGALVDDWQVGENSGGFTLAVINNGRLRTGSWALRINTPNGVALANGANAFAGAWTATNFPCTAGDWFTVGGYMYRDASQSQPSGVSIFLLIMLRWFNATGGYLGQDGPRQSTIGGDMSTPQSKNVVAPAGAASYKVYCQVLVGNSSGATITMSNAWCGAGFDDLFVKRIPDIGIAGSGQTVGDQRNLLPVTWAGVRSVLSTSPISYSISGTTVNFSVAAFTLQGGGISISYSASSGSVTQAAGTTVGYYLYYRDATASGGSKSLFISTAPQSLAAFPDIVMLGTATVTVASSGGGAGGTGGGGGGYCVADDMFIGEGRRAGNAEIGDPFDCFDLPTAAGRHVRSLQGVSRGIEECVRMITSDGCMLVCSVSTPFDLPDGRVSYAKHMLGERVITDLGEATVLSLALVGRRSVTRAHLGGVSYAAGADPTRRIIPTT